MEYTSVTVELSTEDVVALSRFFEKENAKWMPLAKWQPYLQIGVAIMLSASLLHFLQGSSPPTPWYAALMGFSIGFTLMGSLYELGKLWLRRRIHSEGFLKKTDPSVFLPSRYQMQDEGLYQESDRGRFLTHWTAFDRVLESEKHFWVMYTKTRGEVFPKRCFFTPEGAENFANQVRSRIEKNAAAPSVSGQASLVINVASA